MYLLGLNIFKEENALSKAALTPALVQISGDLVALPRLTGNNPLSCK